MRIKIDVRRECDCCPDSATTRALGQRGGIAASARRAAKWVLLHVAEAAMADLLLLSLGDPQASIAHEHTEALGNFGQSWSIFSNGTRVTHGFEGSDRCLAIIRRNIVYGDTTNPALQSQIQHLWHSLKGTVPCSKVQIRGPVVGKVLAKRTRGTGRLRRGIVLDGRHGDVK